MNLQIGKNIKRLRIEQNITQEKLAEYLNVAYQTVSKWENGISLPSVLMLPSIANIFGVSIDELYDLEKKAQSEKIKRYKVEYERLCNDGDNKGRVSLMRKAVAEFPKNYEFMLNLARSLYWADFGDEIFVLCERILDECREEKTRLYALQTLARSYFAAGQNEEAKKYAIRLPSIEQSREFLMADISEGEEKKRFLQHNLLSFLAAAAKALFIMADDYDDEMTPEERINFYETVITLYNTVLDDNKLWANVQMYYAYALIAGNYSIMGNTEKAVEYILEAEKYAKSADKFFCGGSQKFTSKFLDGFEVNPKDYKKHWKNSHCENLYNKMQKRWFDNIRGNDEFKAVNERLRI